MINNLRKRVGRIFYIQKKKEIAKNKVMSGVFHIMVNASRSEDKENPQIRFTLFPSVGKQKIILL